MKPLGRFGFVRIAAGTLLISLSLLLGSAAAGTFPVSNPKGLTLDSKGNLYVANFASNQVLVYSPAYAQLTSKTISTNVSGPSAVAFDPTGNLWVANNTSNSITEYAPIGTQVPGATLTYQISDPQAMAIDGLGDVWVQDGFSSVSVYAAYQTAPFLTFPVSPVNGANGIATYEMAGAVGSNANVEVFEISLLLSNQAGAGVLASPCFSLAFDSAFNLYCGNIDSTLSVFSKSGLKTLAKLPFFPAGLAVDSARGRIYIAGGTANEIAVYSLSGKQIHKIQ